MRLENNIKWTPKQSTTDGLMCNKEEIKDFLEVNSQKDIINYIFKLETDVKKCKGAVETMKKMLENRVTKDRYNNIIKKYNDLIKKTR